MTLSSLALDAFYSVAQIGNFTKAAEELHITQSALSQRILNLEEELQTTLLIRERGALRLTPAGESLLRYCQAQKSLQTEFLTDLQTSNSKTLQGTYRIGGFSSVVQSIAFPALAPLLRENPIQISFQIDQMDNLLELLKRGEIDLVLLESAPERNDLEKILLGHEENVWIKSLKHDNQHEWYLDHHPKDPTTHRYFQKFGPKKKNLKRRYMDNVYGLIDGVRLGLGEAIVPVHLIENAKDIEIRHPKQILKMPVWACFYTQPFYSRLHEQILKDLTVYAKSKFS